MKKKFKIISPHPIQYQVPLWRQLVADGWQIEAAYYQRGAAGRSSLDPGFGIEIQWDVDLLSGYPHIFFNRGEVTYSPREQVRCFGKMLGWMLKDRSTPILFMGWFAESIWVLWLMAVWMRRPHLMISETTPGSFDPTSKPGWRVAFLKWLLKKTPACLYIGELNREFLLAMGVREERLFHAPYSVDNERFEREASRLKNNRAELLRMHGLDPALPAFLFCGKLIHKKRPLQLLEGYFDANLQDCAQLIFFGDGILRSEMEKQILSRGAKHIHIMGFLNQSRMPLAYVLGDVLCLISDATETWGLVVNEAMACGCPVIVSDAIGCAPDLVKPDTGWIVPLDDRAVLAGTLRHAYEQRHRWATMGMAGQKKISAHTFSRMAAGLGSAVSSMTLPLER